MSPLKDKRLTIAEVRDSGSYVEPKLKKIKELEPAIINFLPEIRIKQKVIIINKDKQSSTVKI